MKPADLEKQLEIDEAIIDALKPATHLKFVFTDDNDVATRWSATTNVKVGATVSSDHSLTTLGGPVEHDLDGHTIATDLDDHAYQFNGFGELMRSTLPTRPPTLAAQSNHAAWATAFVYGGLGRLVAVDRQSVANPKAPPLRSVLTYLGATLVRQTSVGDTRLYVPGADAPIAAFIRNGQRYYAHAGQGSWVERLSRKSGKIAEFYSHTPFGRVQVYDDVGQAVAVSPAGFDAFHSGQIYLPWSGLQKVVIQAALMDGRRLRRRACMKSASPRMV